MANLILLGFFSGSVWEIIGQTSVFGLFILAVLLSMSLISWVIVFGKWRLFRVLQQNNDGFAGRFRKSRKLSDVIGHAKTYRPSPLSAIYLAGVDELEELKERKNEASGLREKAVPLDNDDFEIIEMTMERTLTNEISRMEKQVIFLATTGSSAPFMGLLGTVVGIMDSFWAIGERGSASLAVVAPGIAEALLATIVGLGAAIPAVMAYNWASNRIKQMNDSGFSFILDFIGRARKEQP